VSLSQILRANKVSDRGDSGSFQRIGRDRCGLRSGDGTSGRDRDMGGTHMGLQARLMSQALKADRGDVNSRPPVIFVVAEDRCDVWQQTRNYTPGGPSA
jgi:hypothetical protein